jgi:hypothetical protein
LSRTRPEITALLVSLWHAPFQLSRSFQIFHLAPRPSNGCRIVDKEFTQSFSTLTIRDCPDRMDIGDKRGIPSMINAEDIAADLIDNDNLGKFGIFVAAGPTPTPEELELARAILIKKAKDLVADGDMKWARLETRKEITDLNRWAVLQLGETREWAYEYQEPAPIVAVPNCPACGIEQKIASPAICWNCRYPIDLKKAQQLGLLPDEEPEDEQPEIVGRGSGGRFTKKGTQN